MWQCPICEEKHKSLCVCTRCGFDGSCDYETFATAFAVTGARSICALQKEWKKKQGPQTAQEWYQKAQKENDMASYAKAAELGYAPAQVQMGYYYFFGINAAKDHVQAANWYQRAAEQGNAKAQNDLGECYYYGQGVPQDLAKAVMW